MPSIQNILNIGAHIASQLRQAAPSIAAATALAAFAYYASPCFESAQPTFLGSESLGQWIYGASAPSLCQRVIAGVKEHAVKFAVAVIVGAMGGIGAAAVRLSNTPVARVVNGHPPLVAANSAEPAMKAEVGIEQKPTVEI